MIIISSSGRSINSRNNNCRSAVAAVVDAITTNRNCIIIISSSSSNSNRSCNSSSISICTFTLSLLKIVIVMAVIIAKMHLRIFSECPKTSDHNSNATPIKELQCFDALS